jgi:hypothetical protein
MSITTSYGRCLRGAICTRIRSVSFPVSIPRYGVRNRSSGRTVWVET